MPLSSARLPGFENFHQGQSKIKIMSKIKNGPVRGIGFYRCDSTRPLRRFRILGGAVAEVRTGTEFEAVLLPGFLAERS